MQVTKPSAASVMLATFPEVLALDPELAVHERLSNVQPVGLAPSVTVYDPECTLVQSSTFPPATGGLLSTPATSLSVNTSADESATHVSSAPALAVVMVDVK